jgi:hypothetical protein
MEDFCKDSIYPQTLNHKTKLNKKSHNSNAWFYMNPLI